MREIDPESTIISISIWPARVATETVYMPLYAVIFMPMNYFYDFSIRIIVYIFHLFDCIESLHQIQNTIDGFLFIYEYQLSSNKSFYSEGRQAVSSSYNSFKR